MPTTQLEYSPTTQWSPEYIPLELAEVAKTYLNDGPDLDIESNLTARLAATTHGYINSLSSSKLYRADIATERKEGNCMAYTEVAGKLGKALKLDVMVKWVNNCHADVAFIGKKSIWRIDGMDSSATEWNDHNNKHKVINDTVRAANSGQYSTYIQELLGAFDQTPITHRIDGELGDFNPKTENLKRTMLVMPLQQGLQFLGAYGDFLRYRDQKPELFDLYKDELRRFIPQNIQPE